MRLKAALAALGLLGATGCADPQVVRVVDGRAQAGRYVSATAYAAYAYASDAEARGDLVGAARGFDAASAEDPRSPEIRTHLGALRCAAARSDEPPPVEALADFDRAEADDASFAPLHRERARCLLSHGRAADARGPARRAGELDPSDVDAFVLLAEALERGGDVEGARRTLYALTVTHPRAATPWLALLGLATRGRDAALAHEAARRARALGAALPPETAEPAFAAIDAALRAGDAGEARRLAMRARLASHELALRAAALGLTKLARAEAELVLGADPRDASARIALAVAADLEGDRAALARAMRDVPRGQTAASPLARWLFAEILARRVGADAARAWLGPLGALAAETPEAKNDALLAATSERVRARLATH